MKEKIEQQLESILQRTTAAAERANRHSEKIVVVGAAKSQPIERIVTACRAGLRHVGENFAQEARDKIPQVNAQLQKEGISPPTWHFIGHLQRNKVRIIVPLIDCVQSVDRVELAYELDRRASHVERTIEVLLQVNLNSEPQKGGVRPDSLSDLLAECQPLSHLRVTGLMAVPAQQHDPEKARTAFATLRELLREHRHSPGGKTLHSLSMGMSTDFEVAIEEGSTQIRIGSALFGARE